MFSGVSPLGTKAITGNPLFQLKGSTPDSLYSLLKGSPAINSGVMYSGITDGYIGSAPDIGAIEAGAPAWYPGIGGARVDNLAVPPRPDLVLHSIYNDTVSIGIGKGGSPAYGSIGSVGLNTTGSWICFYGVNLRNGYDSLAVLYVFNDYGGNFSLSVRLDSVTGTEIGSTTPIQTGSWSTFKKSLFKLSAAAKGIHDIYFINRGAKSGSIGSLEFTHSINTPGLPTQAAGGSEGKSDRQSSRVVTPRYHVVLPGITGEDFFLHTGGEILLFSLNGQMAARSSARGSENSVLFPASGVLVKVVKRVDASTIDGRSNITK